jgi:GNAT superfamily N-acetyltransferase
MDSPASIRLAVTCERRALEALQRRASLGNPGDRAAILANPDAIELPESQIEARRVLVAERRGAVVGFAVILPRHDGDAELDGLFVEPASWGQGIGRELIEHCARVARGEGAAALHVIGNPHAEGFYLGCGFERCGTVQTRFGVGLVFRRPLSRAHGSRQNREEPRP